MEVVSDRVGAGNTEMRELDGKIDTRSRGPRVREREGGRVLMTVICTLINRRGQQHHYNRNERGQNIKSYSTNRLPT